MKVECICTSNITATLNNDCSNQAEDADLEIGQDARVLAVAMEEDGQHWDVRSFLTMSVSLM